MPVMLNKISEFQTDNQVQNIDSALRVHATNLQQLICLQCNAAKVCESRNQSSLPALNIIWDWGMPNTATLIDHVQKVLHNLLRRNSPLLYVCNTSQYAVKYSKYCGIPGHFIKSNLSHDHFTKINFSKSNLPNDFFTEINFSEYNLPHNYFIIIIIIIIIIIMICRPSWLNG